MPDIFDTVSVGQKPEDIFDQIALTMQPQDVFDQVSLPPEPEEVAPPTPAALPYADEGVPSDVGMPQPTELEQEVKLGSVQPVPTPRIDQRPEIPELGVAPQPTGVDKFLNFISPRPADRMPPPEIAKAQIRMEAHKAGLPMERYVGKVNPQSIPLKRAERFLDGVGQGAVGTIGSMLGAVDWLADSDVARDLSNKTRVWAKQKAPEDPDFADALASGVGSAAVFFVPGIGVAKGVSTLASVSPRLAVWAGASVSAVIESMTEAGSVYQDVLRDTGDEQQASSRATVTFIANLPLNAVTNKLGIFGEKGGRIKKSIVSGLIEGGQEGTQETISALATDKPITAKNLATAVGVGIITGGGLGAITTLNAEVSELRQRRNSTTDTAELKSINKDLATKEAELVDIINKMQEKSKSATAEARFAANALKDSVEENIKADKIKEPGVSYETLAKADLKRVTAEEAAAKLEPMAGVELPIDSVAPSGEVVSGGEAKFTPKPLRILSEETGAIKINPEALEQGKVKAQEGIKTLGKIFTAFKGLDAPTTQAFINIREGDIELREHAAQVSHEAFKDYSDEQLRAVQLAHEQPNKYPMPESAKQLSEDISDLQKWSFKEINKLSLTTKEDIRALEGAVDKGLTMPSSLKPKLELQQWPENEIDKLNIEIERLALKAKHADNPETSTEIGGKIAEIVSKVEQLKNTRYLHRITSPLPIKKRIAGGLGVKTITKKPSGLLGRKFTTIEEAEAAGREVKGLPSAVADLIYITNRTIQMDEFIKSINRNSGFSLSADKAPSDWVRVDDRKFPSGRYRKFHPAIADALNEISYTSNKGELTKAYDKINTAAKIIGFYNPLFMTRYNVSQGIRAAGFTWAKKIPEAMKIWSEKGDTYNYLRKNGLFNNAFDMKPAISDITEQLRVQMNQPGLSEKFKNVANEVLDPVKLVADTWKTLNQGTWKIDEAQRIATWLQLKDNPRLKRKYSDFEIIELTNDFHANYGKVPARTREQLNRAIFTPTYRISMARIVGKMHSETAKGLSKGEVSPLAAPLMRHYIMKILFNKYLPMALTAYFGYKELDKRAKVEGYRVIISEPGAKKETVYSMSDPLLEATKILNRPYNRTIEYNLAAIPAAMTRLIRGPMWESKDPDWKEKVSSFFKVGIPGLREMRDWEQKDKETWQKFVQSLGFAFIYQRNSRPELKQSATESLMRAMDLWVDWKTFLDLQEPTTLFKEVLGAAKKKGVSEKNVRLYMQQTWGERNFGRLSFQARKNVLEHFSDKGK